MSPTRPYKSPSDDGDTFDNTIFFHGASSSFAESDMMLLGDSFDPTSNGIGLIHGGDDDNAPSQQYSPAHPQSTTPSHHTSTTVATLPPRNEEEKENQDSADDSDTIRDEILYVRHKASILQRASHILLQSQRDYPSLASFHACLQETKQLLDHPSLVMNQMTIWDEARYFLESENDAPEEITCKSPETPPPPEDGPFPDLTVSDSMKSLSAVQQYYVAHRSHPPTDSPSVVPAVRPLGPAEAASADTNQPIRVAPPKYRIDTSSVQCVTSSQFDTARPLNEPITTTRMAMNTENDGHRTVDHWYNSQTGADVSDHHHQKQRQRGDAAVATMGPPSTTATPLDHHMNHARDVIRRRHRHPNTKLFRHAGRRPHVPASLRPFQRLLLSSFHPASPQRHDQDQGDKWKLLHQATRMNRVN